MAKPTEAVQLPLPLEVLATALADPLVIYPSGWDLSLPEWLRQAVTEERLARLATGDGDGLPASAGLATLAEALAYLYCAGLTVPLSHEWAEIYGNLAARYMADRGATLPEDMQPRDFTDYEERLLDELRRDIRCSQVREAKKQRRERRKKTRE